MNALPLTAPESRHPYLRLVDFPVPYLQELSPLSKLRISPSNWFTVGVYWVGSNRLPADTTSSGLVSSVLPPPSPLSESSKSTRKSKRPKGQGSGYIQLHYCEKQTQSGIKSYEQYYYHYELEVKGKRVKRSAYIPKDKLDVVLEWERKKIAVIAILSYLGKSV